MSAVSAPDEAGFFRQLAFHAGLPFVRLEPSDIAGDPFLAVDPAVASLLSETVCRHFSMLPVTRTGNLLTVALVTPADDLALHAAAALSGLEIAPVIASRADIERTLDRVFGPEGDGAEQLNEATQPAPGEGAPMRLGEVLLAHGAVTQEQIAAALDQQQRSGGRIGEILLHNVWIDEATLANVLAAQMELPIVDLSEMTPEPAALARLPEPVMRELHCVPIAVDDKTLYVAVPELLDEEALSRVREYSALEVNQFLATKSSVENLLQRLFSDAYIDTATYDMLRRFPEDSAHRVITSPQRVVLAAVLIVVAVAVALFPLPALEIVLGLASAFYFAVSFYKIYLTYSSLGHEYELQIGPAELAAIDERDLPVYTILVPLFREAEVIPGLSKRIAEFDYPKHLLDVRLLCETEDLETIETIRSLNLPPHFKLVVVPPSKPQTKPKACNYGLLHAEGKFCVIYDAEDQPDPDQLKRVVLAFEKANRSVTCVQAKLNYFNYNQNFLTRWFAAEYSMWFDLVLPGLDAQNVPIPLGGTSNHFVTSRLTELGAWDPFNVTEDADLGIRLHKAGFTTAIIDSVTLEEANSEVHNWVRQRSRWIKGYIQTWLVHMRHPMRLLRELGLRSFISFNLIVGGAFIFLLNPLFWLLTTLFVFTQSGLISQLFPGIVFYGSSLLLFVGNFVFVYMNVAGVVQRQQYALTKSAFLSPLYWALMSLAAWKGFIQLFTNPFYWEKTEHGLQGSGHEIGG